MVYTHVIKEILDNIGGAENVATIKKNNRTELAIVILSDRDVNLQALRNIHKRIKRVQLLGDRVIFYLQKRDVTGLFQEFKNLPNSEVVKIKDTYQEDEPDYSHLTYFERLKNSALNDFLPLIIGMAAAGYLIGVVSFLGSIAGS